MLNSDHKPIARAAPLVPAFTKLAADQEEMEAPGAEKSLSAYDAPAASSSAAAALTRRRRGSTCSAITACTFGASQATATAANQQLSTVVEEQRADGT